MPVPFPVTEEALQTPPDEDEVQFVASAIATAVAPSTGLTELQRMLIRAISQSITGYDCDPDPSRMVGPEELAARLGQRDRRYRTRLLQYMVLCELVLDPIPDEVSERVERYAAELGVEEGMVAVARDYARGALGLALVDFERNGYTADWDPGRAEYLHTERVSEPWEAVDDPVLAKRWASLEDCPSGSLGRRVFEFYRARGFLFPGLPGAAPPQLAQHDWVHVLADYGTTVKAELEVFGLIGRAIPDFRGFSLLAMVISLFETGHLERGAGLFEADPGHLSAEGMALRLADALRRGMRCDRDLMSLDWFDYAEKSVEQVRRELRIVPKSELAVFAGSVGPWEAGGISPTQQMLGRRLAEEEGRSYESYGATPDE